MRPQARLRLRPRCAWIVRERVVLGGRHISHGVYSDDSVQTPSQAVTPSNSGTGTSSESRTPSSTRSVSLTPSLTPSQAATTIPSGTSPWGCCACPPSPPTRLDRYPAVTYFVVTKASGSLACKLGVSSTYFCASAFSSPYCNFVDRFNGGPLNPTIALYKGRTYTFNVSESASQGNAPG